MPPFTVRRRPAPPTAQMVHLPAPMGGLNTISAGSAMSPGDCVQLYNLIPAEMGLRSRLGYREWCTGLTGLADDEVRAILPFSGSTSSADRLFACTSTGIWDVSSSSASPTEVLSFGTQTGRAGWGQAHVVVTSAGHFLAYCDEVNGLHVYTESTDTWAAVAMGGGGTEISGVDPATFVGLTVFKNRLCFVKRDSADFYYLAAGALYGAATRFSLGTRFRAGGHLVNLYNWTYDGGAGIDDALVAISSGGDVAIYKGTDPSSANSFGLKGVWFIGATPAGRDVATNFGGDILLLSRTGAIPLSRLVVGGTVDAGQYATAKISNLFNSTMLSKATTWGWRIRMHPEDNSLIITVPTYEGSNTEQFVMSLTTKAWSRYRDLPIFSAESWQGKLYFGTADGRVCINDGYTDARTLADPDAYTPVQWALLGAFQNLGNGNQKQVTAIRPTILSESEEPNYEVAAKYKHDLTELATVSGSTSGANAWDSALWDTGVWGGEYVASQEVRGATGMGVEVAIAARGQATSRTVLVGFDVSYTQGGFL